VRRKAARALHEVKRVCEGFAHNELADTTATEARRRRLNVVDDLATQLET
jgi:hypothetical protein